MPSGTSKGRLRPRQHAPGKRDAQGAGAVVGRPRGALDLVEVGAFGGAGAGDLEDDQVARDAPALVPFVRGGGGNVIGHQDGPAVDALAAQPVLR